MKKIRPSWTFESLSKACGVQKTYLSRVLNHKGDLSADQTYEACKYLKFNTYETEFLIQLREYNICQNSDRKQKLKKELNKYIDENQKSESVLKVSEISKNTNTDLYNMDPLYPLIHMFLTIFEYRKNPQLISKSLGLSEKRLNQYLDGLQDYGIIELKNESYKVIKDNLHLPKESPVQPIYRMQMRLNALEKMKKLEEDSYYSFTAIFSTNEIARKKIHECFLSFLKQTQKISSEYPESEVYQMNFDLLKWT